MTGSDVAWFPLLVSQQSRQKQQAGLMSHLDLPTRPFLVTLGTGHDCAYLWHRWEFSFMCGRSAAHRESMSSCISPRQPAYVAVACQKNPKNMSGVNNTFTENRPKHGIIQPDSWKWIIRHYHSGVCQKLLLATRQRPTAIGHQSFGWLSYNITWRVDA